MLLSSFKGRFRRYDFSLRSSHAMTTICTKNRVVQIIPTTPSRTQVAFLKHVLKPFDKGHNGGGGGGACWLTINN